jgi:hypothetical protein
MDCKSGRVDGRTWWVFGCVILLVVTVLAGSGCGENQAATIDASLPADAAGGADGAEAADASPPDAAVADAAVADAAPPDATPPDADPGCTTIGNAGTVGSDPNLFGAIAYFGGPDHILPAGRYRIRYVDGCMKYASPQGWTVHAIGGGFFQWFVGTSAGDTLRTPPGTVGHVVGQGGFADFADCVAANAALPPVEFDFAGGPLGVWLADSPVSDNVTGEDGRNPRWSLSAIGGCADAGG